ncbi:alpha/beta hydrolase [Cohnella candidum]|uniref:Alpha/beta hydrolase n=1 Tax=Cohnella candidum TaxID=2674991 RepID=A0A3G3JTJ0_9BACL|nr:alpha/beta hydrolase [Cohnella candidum]AYQ71560.1 alpha/beta hydrolase [Cohnella candidum]
MRKVEMLEGLVYSSPGGRALIADLYLPQGSEETAPVILWLHGGGWRVGDRKLGPDLSRYFAERGFAMASIDYRLSGEAKFPAQIEDVLAAIDWLCRVGPEYGIDAKRIGLWGSSAGGHLAAMAGALRPAVVRAVADGYGPTDFLQMDDHRIREEKASDDPESVRLHPGNRSADPDSPESQLLGAPIGEVPEKVREANPITFVKPDMPPYLILHGLSDLAVPSHQSELLFTALASGGNDATLGLVPGLGHGFFNRNDLGQDKALPMQVRHSSGQVPEWMPEGEPRLSFDFIEAFFRFYL